MGVVSENFPDISFIDNCTVEEVLAQMINDYQEKYKELTGKDVSLAQADPYRLIMYACTAQIYQGMQYADSAGKMGLLKYSRGNYLDNLAPLKGVQRLEATEAITTIKFEIESAIESAVAIPAGTRVTNGNDIYFATDEYAEIAAGETSVTVPATCTVTGTAGNGFAPGEFNVLVNTLPYISKVMNTDTTSGGAETEDDESLKDRIFKAPGSYSTAGSKLAYEYHTRSVNQTISDVVTKKISPGVVGVYFVCNDGELPGESLIEEVAEHLNERTVRPLTDEVIVQAPMIQEYNVEFTYYIATSDKSIVSTIQADIETAVSMYNKWQTEKIGRDINPSQLIRRVMAAGAKRIEVASPIFTVLDETAIAKLGTLNMVYGGLEDD